MLRRNHLVGGGQLALSVRLSRRVGLDFASGAPFPTQSVYLLTRMFVGVGVSLYLR